MENNITEQQKNKESEMVLPTSQEDSTTKTNYEKMIDVLLDLGIVANYLSVNNL